MLPMALPKTRFAEFAGFLMKSGWNGRPARVVAPLPKGPQFAFADIESDRDIGRIRMDYDITILPL